MYLRASDKASGVENFHSAVGSKLIRRELVDEGPAAGAHARHGLEALQFPYAKTLEKPLAVGVLGTGRQGLRLLAAVNPAFIAVKSIADIRPSNQDRAIEALRGDLQGQGLDDGRRRAERTFASTMRTTSCWQPPRPTGWRP